MNRLSTITITLSLLLAPVITFATEGKVVAFKPACGYLLITGEKGYLLVKQQGGSSYLPKQNDLIDGAFIENYGMSHLQKVSGKEVMWVFNENSWLSKEDATKKYVAKCGPIETHPVKDVIKKTTEIISKAAKLMSAP